jgi:hypothetical protein
MLTIVDAEQEDDNHLHQECRVALLLTRKAVL